MDSVESKTCPVCGREFTKRADQLPSVFRRQVHCSVDCGRRARFLRRQRERPTSLTGDRRYRLRFVAGRFDGRNVSREGSWLLEHRLVMEAQIGRKLERNEHVHHLNHDGLDNRPENLQLLTKEQHSRVHAQERADRGYRIRGPVPPVEVTCPVCGQEFSVPRSQYAKRKRRSKSGLVVCSTRCAQTLGPPPPPGGKPRTG